MPDPNTEAEKKALLDAIRAEYLNGTATPAQVRSALVDYYRRFGASPEDAQVLADSTVTTWGRPGQTTPGGMPRPPQGKAGAPVGLREEELGGLPAYLRTLTGAGVPQAGPFAAFARSQYGPALEAFLGTQAATGGEVPSQGYFEEQPFLSFLNRLQGSTPGTARLRGTSPETFIGPSRIGQAAQKAYEQLRNALAFSTQGVDPRELTAYQRQYALPQTQEEFGFGGGLARQAATGRMGGLAARYLMPSERDLYERFLGGPQGGDVAQWLPWLQQQLGF